MHYREISEAFLLEKVVKVGKFYGTWLHGLKRETAKDYLLFGLELNNLFIHAIPRLPDLHIPEGKAAKEVDVWRYVQDTKLGKSNRHYLTGRSSMQSIIGSNKKSQFLVPLRLSLYGNEPSRDNL